MTEIELCPYQPPVLAAWEMAPKELLNKTNNKIKQLAIGIILVLVSGLCFGLTVGLLCHNPVWGLETGGGIGILVGSLYGGYLYRTHLCDLTAAENNLRENNLQRMHLQKDLEKYRSEFTVYTIHDSKHTFVKVSEYRSIDNGIAKITNELKAKYPHHFVKAMRKEIEKLAEAAQKKQFVLDATIYGKIHKAHHKQKDEVSTKLGIIAYLKHYYHKNFIMKMDRFIVVPSETMVMKTVHKIQKLEKRKNKHSQKLTLLLPSQTKEGKQIRKAINTLEKQIKQLSIFDTKNAPPSSTILKSVPSSNPSKSEIAEYKSVGEQVIAETAKCIPFSSNMPNQKFRQNNSDKEGTFLEEFYEKLDHTIKALSDLRALTNEEGEIIYARSTTIKYGIEDPRYIECLLHLAKMAEKYSLGNCFERSAFAFRYLMQNTNVERIDLCNINGGDHSFIIIGRGKKFCLEDDWIIDPWAMEVYPASQYKTRLHNWEGTDLISGKPILKLINTQTQSIGFKARFIRSVRLLA
jgi:hypothetical protein